MESEPVELEPIKCCTKCKDPKPLEEFFVITYNRIRKDGTAYVYKRRNSRCRKCHAQVNKEYANNSPEYRERHRQSCKESRRKYIRKYRQKHNEYNRIKMKEKYQKIKIGKVFKYKPKPIDGYQLVKGHDGMWRFLIIK